MNFASDNTSGISPEILAAIGAANEGAVGSYGADPVTSRLETKLADLFEHEVAVFPVATGTAANALALAALTPPWGAVFCHPLAHIISDEANAPEFYSGGAKLVPIDGTDGKLTAADLAARLPGDLGNVHHAQPAAVSLTQATECGTVYRPHEIAEIATVAHRHGLAVHMDGARFANALVHLDASPADLTWRSGVDALSLGATKNGALGAEAIVFFDTARAGELAFRRKRAGHLFSKMRFLSAQLDAYVTGDLWRRNARHANDAASRLAEGLAALPGVSLRHPVEANELFVEMPEAMIVGLFAAGAKFYRWGGEASTCVRLVTAWNTSDADVAEFLGAASRLGNV
jgi:threonine aldolase